jgi:hypothetical protein
VFGFGGRVGGGGCGGWAWRCFWLVGGGVGGGWRLCFLLVDVRRVQMDLGGGTQKTLVQFSGVYTRVSPPLPQTTTTTTTTTTNPDAPPRPPQTKPNQTKPHRPAVGGAPWPCPAPPSTSGTSSSASAGELRERSESPTPRIVPRAWRDLDKPTAATPPPSPPSTYGPPDIQQKRNGRARLH